MFDNTHMVISASAVIFIGGSYLWARHLLKMKERAYSLVARIDVALQKRHRLAPEIVQIVDKFMFDQRELVADAISLLLEPPVAPAIHEITILRRYLTHAEKLGELMHFMCALAPKYEAYQDFPRLDEMLDTFYANEAEVVAARKSYNIAVSNLRVAIALFPASFIAKMVNVRELPEFGSFEAHDMRGKPVLVQDLDHENDIDITHHFL